MVLVKIDVCSGKSRWMKWKVKYIRQKGFEIKTERISARLAASLEGDAEEMFQVYNETKQV